MIKNLIIIITLSMYVYGFKIEQEFNIQNIEVKKHNITPYKEFYGKVTIDEDKIYDINVRFDGFITKLYTSKNYQYVSSGDKLFDIYSKEIYNLFEELELAKKSSKELYDATRNKLYLYDIDEKNKKEESVTIKSKIDGYITKNNINQNSFVQKGQKIFEISDMSRVWLIVNVYQKDIAFIKEGLETEIMIDGLDKKLSSKVDYIYPVLNAKDQTIPIRIILDNKEKKLFPNMFAKVKIYEKGETVLTVPKNAVIKRDGKLYVFFKDGKEYSPSEIKAVRIPQGYKIIEGLEEGDVIVKNALFLLDSDAITNGLYSDDW